MAARTNEAGPWKWLSLNLTPQGLARADAEGTAALLGPTQPGYPGVEKTISVPRPYVAFKRLGRTLA